MVPLSITIPIAEENIDLHKRTITKNSDEKELFIKEVIACSQVLLELSC